MLSRIEGSEYVILCDDSIYPERFDKKELNQALTDAKNKVDDLVKYLDELDEQRPDMYRFIRNEVIYGWTSLQDLELVSRELDYTLECLQNNQDEIKEPEPPKLTLRDVGFKNHFSDDIVYEKLLEDTEEREVAEEIVLPKKEAGISKPLHRIRTVIWEKTDYGRASKEIKYEEIDFNDTLLEYTKNTIEENA